MMLDAAIAYCRAGLPVFPLEPGGKAPIRGLPGGFHAASIEESVAIARFSMWPTANLGVAVPDCYVVIDVDPRNGGHFTVEALEAQHGALPATLTARTGTGGRHLWFRKPPGLKLRKSLGKGVDIINGTGYVAAPPSRTQREYVWEDIEHFDLAEIAELPDWLAKLLAVPDAETTAQVAQSPQGYMDARQIEEVTSALAHLDPSTYETWLNVGMALHSTNAPQALEMWLEWSRGCEAKYNHKACLDKWRSFGRDGKAGLTYRSIFQWAQEAGWVNPLAGAAVSSAAPLMPVFGAAAVNDAASFISQWTPPEFLVDGIIQRSYVYALTGHSNAGKTACLTLMETCIALGLRFANRDTERGKVVVLCGENPDDYRNRLIATCQSLFISPDALAGNLIVIPRAFPVGQGMPWLRQRLQEIGEVSLIVVDTFAAYFEGDDENSNVQARYNAQQWRSLTEGPGRPAVIIACHPTKSAERDKLEPRGGSAAKAEMDTNLTVWKEGETIQFHHEKIRGPSFDMIELRLCGRQLEGYADTKGRAVLSVVAEPIVDSVAQEMNAAALSEENTLLAVMYDGKDRTMTEWAEACGWLMKDGSAYKMRVQRALKRLRDDKLVRLYRRRWILTEQGKKEAEKSIAEKLRASVPEVRFPAKDGSKDARNP